MKKGEICLSFDDGREDNFIFVYPILKKYGLRATLNVTTGFVLREEEAMNAAKGFEPMTKENVVELYESGVFEIAAHGHLHKNTQEDIQKGVEMLTEWLGKEWLNQGVGFASPYDAIGEDRYLNEKTFFDNLNVFYVRGNSYRRNFFHRLGDKLVSLMFKKRCKNIFQSYWIRRCMQKPVQRTFFRSIGTNYETPLEQWKKFVDVAAKQRKTCIFMIHSVLPKGSSMYGTHYTYDANKFEELCKYLRKLVDAGKIEVTTNMEIYQNARKQS